MPAASSAPPLLWPPPGVAVSVGQVTRTQGEPLPVGDEVGADEVGGADVVAFEVGALEVGADDVCFRVGGGGGGVYGAWLGSWIFSGTFAAGGKLSTGRPTRSAFITAAQVAVGYPAPK
jgi:hypothetical protein